MFFFTTKHLNTIQKQPELVFTAIDIDTVTKSGRNTIENIGLLCGCEVYDKFKHTPADFIANKERFLGDCEKVIVEEKSTQIIGK